MLEEILVSVTQRRDQLEEDIKKLDMEQHEKDEEPRKSSNRDKRRLPPGGKQEVKKYKDSDNIDEIMSEEDNALEFSQQKSENIQTERQKHGNISLTQCTEQQEEVRGRFWKSVEPYCADITNDDIQTVENLILECENDSEYEIVPLEELSLSESSSDHMLQEQNEENIASGVSNLSSSSQLISSDEENDPEDKLGPLTKRLVCSLIEIRDENTTGDCTDVTPGCASNFPEIQNFLQSCDIIDCAGLEERVRKELEDIGILDPEDTRKDTVLSELIESQKELKSLSKYNREQLQILLKKSKKQLRVQDMQKTLDACNQKIIEINNKFLSSGKTSKDMTKSQKDNAWMLLREREQILKRIEEIKEE